MPKRLIQDVKIYAPARRPPFQKEIEVERGERRRGSKHTLWFVALVSIIFFVFALSYLWSGAEVVINPKVKDEVLNANLSASRFTGPEALPFDLVVLSGEKSKEIRATGEKEVSERARGKVIIYNDFGSAPQNLTIDTRLEGSNGKIYKTLTKTTIPGRSTSGTPGSVEVDVYADTPGSEYNSPPLDFKIFGFKGTPKYEKFYARSKGTITGGLLGKFPSVEKSEEDATLRELEQTLQAELLKKAADQIPSGFILFKEAVFLNIDSQDASPLSAEGNFSLKIKGTLYGILFEEKALAEKLIESSFKEYVGQEIFISNIRDLAFSLANRGALSKDIREIDFNLSGTAKIVWKFDADKLASELRGKSKKDFNQILSQYENIDSADLSLSPVWKRSFPNDLEDIKVMVAYPPAH